MMLRKTGIVELSRECIKDASMRPQHDAAENAAEAIDTKFEQQASMRPQHDAAENIGRRRLQARCDDASMRPQHDAAENQLTRVGVTFTDKRFNEAAA